MPRKTDALRDQQKKLRELIEKPRRVAGYPDWAELWLAVAELQEQLDSIVDWIDEVEMMREQLQEILKVGH